MSEIADIHHGVEQMPTTWIISEIDRYEVGMVPHAEHSAEDVIHKTLKSELMRREAEDSVEVEEHELGTIKLHRSWW